MARTRTSPLATGAVFVVVGIMLLVCFLGDALVSLKAPVDIETITAQQVKKGTKVEGKLNFILDSFASLETSTKNTKAKTSNLYYIYELIDTGHIIAFEGKATDETLYNKIIDETYKYVMGESETYGETGKDIVGIIKPMEGELLKFYKEWPADSGYWEGMSEEETDGLLLPYVIEEADFTFNWIVSIAGILAIIIGGLLIIIPTIKKKKASAMASVDYDNGSSQETITVSTTDNDTTIDSPEIK